MWNVQKSGLEQMASVLVCVCVFSVCVRVEKINQLKSENGLSDQAEIRCAKRANTIVSSWWI